MSIQLITGAPGSGKSLRASAMLVEHQQKYPERLRFVAGFEEDDLYGIDFERVEYGFNWTELPDGSLVVVDEAHNHWKQREGRAAMPADVDALSMHRHRGFDFIVVTQHPKKMDVEILRQCTRHYHLVRRYGKEESIGYISEEYTEHRSKTSDRDVELWKFPRALYGLYKSAEVHDTNRRRVPQQFKKMAFWACAGSLVIIILVYKSWFTDDGLYGQLVAAPAPVDVVDADVDVIAPAPVNVIAPAPVDADVDVVPPPLVNADVDVAASTPVDGFDVGADDVYDTLNDVDVVAGCLSTADRCTCFTSGGDLIVPDFNEIDQHCLAFDNRPVLEPEQAFEVIADWVKPASPYFLAPLPPDKQADNKTTQAP